MPIDDIRFEVSSADSLPVSEQSHGQGQCQKPMLVIMANSLPQFWWAMPTLQLQLRLYYPAKTEIRNMGIFLQVHRNKKGGRQGALCSADHPNLQGRFVRFKHLLEVVVQNQIQINGSGLWKFKFNWGPFVEVKSFVVQIHHCQISIAQLAFFFRSKRVFVCPGKLTTEKQSLCQMHLMHKFAKETSSYRRNAKTDQIQWVILLSETTQFGLNHPIDSGSQ